MFKILKEKIMEQNKLMILISVVLSALYNMLYPHYLLFGLLIVVNITDYITALIGAFERKEQISIDKSIRGIARKINALFFVLIALIIDVIINNYFQTNNTFTFISSTVILWLVMHELLSIINNISNYNTDNVPPMILKFLERFKNDGLQ